MTLEVIHTPGHTSTEGRAYCLRGYSFAGSIGSVGSQEEFEQLISIQTKLLVLPAGQDIPGTADSIVDVEKKPHAHDAVV